MPERSQAQSAVAGDDSRDALAHLARHERIGQQCPVIMRVRVDESRSQRLASGMYLLRSHQAAKVSKRDNPIARDRYVAHTGGDAGPIHDPSPSDDQVDWVSHGATSRARMWSQVRTG